VRIESGIGWVKEDGKLVSATPAQYVAEINQLRGNLSLAEEGLANYAQENERLRDAMKSAERLFNTLCFDIPVWVGLHEDVCGPLRAALALTRGAVPQSEPHT
jgi:hypothetical protein